MKLVAANKPKIMYEGVFEGKEVEMLVWSIVLTLGIIIDCEVQCFKSKQSVRLSFLITL